ncbi:MAG: hypothetical protein L0Z48_12480 [candidate division Zixibacteria bacterium]|nr:hypothetical protein [candidate division Zixibacteria bacterium]
MDTNKIAEEIYANLEEVVKAVTAAQGLKGFGLVIPLVLTKVEEARGSVSFLSSEEKKDVAVKVLNKFINLPVLPEWAEAKVIGLAVDWFVNFFNRSFGHGWLANLKGINLGV